MSLFWWRFTTGTLVVASLSTTSNINDHTRNEVNTLNTEEKELLMSASGGQIEPQQEVQNQKILPE